MHNRAERAYHVNFMHFMHRKEKCGVSWKSITATDCGNICKFYALIAALNIR